MIKKYGTKGLVFLALSLVMTGALQASTVDQGGRFELSQQANPVENVNPLLHQSPLLEKHPALEEQKFPIFELPAEAPPAFSRDDVADPLLFSEAKPIQTAAIFIRGGSCIQSFYFGGSMHERQVDMAVCDAVLSGLDNPDKVDVALASAPYEASDGSCRQSVGGKEIILQPKGGCTGINVKMKVQQAIAWLFSQTLSIA